ncbi:MAG: diversity-generating retroelement protein Avd [Nodosilinea sp.]
MTKPAVADLPVIQKAYDLVKWYVPILNRLPRDHRFTLGERIIQGLYDLLEGLIQARYSANKLERLQTLNIRLDLLRHQTRLLFDFHLMEVSRYEYVGTMINDLGMELGGWIKQQKTRQPPSLRSS